LKRIKPRSSAGPNTNPVLPAGLNVIEDQGRFVALSERLRRNCPLDRRRVPNPCGHTEVLCPVFHLIVACHSDLTTIGHNSLREGSSRDLLHGAHSARRFPRRTIIIEFIYFLPSVWRQSLFVCVHASRSCANNDVQETSSFRGSGRSTMSLRPH